MNRSSLQAGGFAVVGILLSALAAHPSLAAAQAPLASAAGHEAAEAPFASAQEEPDAATPTDASMPPASADQQAKAAKTKHDPKLKLGSMGQLLWIGGEPCRGNCEAAGDRRNSFQLARARLDASVKVKGFRFKTKVAFDGGVVKLLNAYAWHDLPLGLEVGLGQFKRILAQTYLVSAQAMQTYERPAAVHSEVASRDIGLRVEGHWARHRVLAKVGVFNGNGPNTKANDNSGLRVEGRLDAAPLGRYDLDSHPIGDPLRIRLGAGMALDKVNDKRKTGAGKQLTEFDDVKAYSAFLAARFVGVELRAEAFQGDITPIDARSTAAQATPLGIAGTRWQGGYAQVAADVPFLEDLQLVALAERWTPDTHHKDTDVDTRWTLAANWYLRGDHAKIQAAWQNQAIAHPQGAEHRWTAYLQLQIAQ